MPRKKNELHEMLIKRLDSIESKVDKVRTEDLPNIRIKMAEDITALKKDVGNDAKMYSGIGGALACLLAVTVSWFRR